MKKKLFGYFMVCVIDSSPTLIQFDNKKTLKKFKNDFKSAYGEEGDGNWIDYIIKGKVIMEDTGTKYLKR